MSFWKNDYEFFDAVRLKAINIPDDSKYVKISLEDGVQISRIDYGRVDRLLIMMNYFSQRHFEIQLQVSL